MDSCHINERRNEEIAEMTMFHRLNLVLDSTELNMKTLIQDLGQDQA